ncbi:Gibberellin-regulated protein 6, partial [Linum perenne]
QQISVYIIQRKLGQSLTYSKAESFLQIFLPIFCEVMAKLVVVLLLALIAISTLQDVVMAARGRGGHHYTNKRLFGPGSLKSYQCPSRCSKRCSKTSHHKPCMFYCQKCCSKCLCVPPGYDGNKAVCPCYNNWKTQQGAPKCP